MDKNQSKFLGLILRLVFGGPIAWCVFIVAIMTIIGTRPGDVDTDISIALGLVRFSAFWAFASIALLTLFLQRVDFDPEPKFLVAPNVTLLIVFVYIYARGLAGA